jgi:hypothetical protein
LEPAAVKLPLAASADRTAAAQSPVGGTTQPEMDPGEFLRGGRLRQEFRTGAKATGGVL